MGVVRPILIVFCGLLVAVCPSADELKGKERKDADGYGNARVERESTKVYHIDVLAVLDFFFYQHWTANLNASSEGLRSVKEYVAYLFHGINRRFSSISELPFRLNVQLSGIIVAETPEDSPWTESVKNATGSGRPSVKADAVLELLKAYVKSNYSSLPPHDHLMLFTGYDMFGEDENTAGLAYVGTVCDLQGRSVSVVEDDGASVSEATAAHELGHSLGAQHDGENNSCSSADRYAMSLGGVHNISESNKLHPWRFSNCSLDYFRKRVQDLVDGVDGEANCLTKKLPQHGVPTAPLVTFPADPDEQCRQTYGSSSYFCREFVSGPEDICLSMPCHNPAVSDRASTCTLQVAASGTCCGSGKWCQLGQCVAEPLAAEKCVNVSDTCPFGEQPGRVAHEGGSKTCGQMEPQYCYQQEVRQKCCERCQKVYTGRTGCEYGDRTTQCDASNCHSQFPQGGDGQYDLDCCGTCNTSNATDTCRDLPVDSIIVKNSTGTTIAVISNTTCSQIPLQLEGTKPCCQAGFRRVCCRSCEDKKSDDAACPYGDCDSGCSVLLRNPKLCTGKHRARCCKTCRDIDYVITTSATITTTSGITSAAVTTTKATNSKVKTPCKVTLGASTCRGSRMATDLIVVHVVVTFLATLALW